MSHVLRISVLTSAILSVIASAHAQAAEPSTTKKAMTS